MRRPRYFYGWNIVGVSFLASMAWAQLTSSLLGLFFIPLQSEFGWSRTAISGVQSFSRVAEGVVQPWLGPLVDRRGPRVMMVVGAAVAGAALLLCTLATELWQFYFMRGVIVPMALAFTGGLVTSITIVNWFVRRRGRALAISHMGTNLTTFLLAPIVVWSIAEYGWRSSFVLFAVMTWVVVLVPAGVFMRRRPEDMGMLPDGEPRATSPQTSSTSGAKETRSQPEPLWTRSEAMATPAFWLLVAASAMSQLAFQGINITVAAYPLDLGHGAAVAAGVLVVRGFVLTASTPAWGFISEHAHHPLVRVAPFVLQGVSCVFFLLGSNIVFLWLAVVVYSLGFAGAGTVQEVLWADYFGRLTLGVVRSTAMPIILVVSAVGPLLMGASYDLTGGYQVAFVGILAFYIVTAAVMWLMSPPTASRFASPEAVA